MKNIKDIFFLGDPHYFDTYDIKRKVERYSLIDCVIVSVGDTNLGVVNSEKEKWHLTLLNELFVERNIFFYTIRGNHDKKDIFDTTRNIYSNIIVVADYDIIEIIGKRILCVGGAISVDRVKRIGDNLFYDKDENFVLKLDKLPINIDIVVTHTAPDFAQPTGFNDFLYDMFKKDENLREELLKERSDMSLLYNVLVANNNITDWFYGHFHKSVTENVNGINFQCLDIMEFKIL